MKKALALVALITSAQAALAGQISNQPESFSIHFNSIGALTSQPITITYEVCPQFNPGGLKCTGRAPLSYTPGDSQAVRLPNTPQKGEIVFITSLKTADGTIWGPYAQNNSPPYNSNCQMSRDSNNAVIFTVNNQDMTISCVPAQG